LNKNVNASLLGIVFPRGLYFLKEIIC